VNWQKDYRGWDLVTPRPKKQKKRRKKGKNNPFCFGVGVGFSTTQAKNKYGGQ